MKSNPMQFSEDELKTFKLALESWAERIKEDGDWETCPVMRLELYTAGHLTIRVAYQLGEKLTVADLCPTFCVHDTHCTICGAGQYDLGGEGPSDEQSDDMSYCKTCQGDVCGKCDCGHDTWGA